MRKLIYVVYLDNKNAPPTGLRAFELEGKARDYIEENRHTYPQGLMIMLVAMED